MRVVRESGLRRARALAGTSLVACLTPVAAATLQLWHLVSLNAVTHVFPWSWIVRPALVLAATAGALVLAVRMVTSSVRESGTATSLALCAFVFFPAIDGRVPPSAIWDVVGGPLFAVSALACGLAVARGLSDRQHEVTALVLLGVIGGTVSRPALGRAGAQDTGTLRLAGASAPVDAPAAARAPDVYYLVLDGLTRVDVLASTFGLDAEGVLAGWGARAQIPPRARSNYAHTYLSLASSLNGDYVAVPGPLVAGVDRHHADALIRRAGMLAAFKSRGYELVLVASDATLVASHPLADRCYCALPSGPTELEYVLLARSPFGRTFDADRWALWAHWNYVLEAFDAVENVRSEKPMLVFAHIMAPHPPFVFSASGGFVPQARYASLDGDRYPGSRDDYVRGYSQQAAFVLNRAASMVDRLVRKATRPVVVIVHGDHGSGVGLSNTEFSASDWHERLAIFSAYLGPPGSPSVPADMSPVNALRWAYAVATGTPPVMVPNRSFASVYERPYDLTEIRETGVATEGASVDAR